MRVTIIPEENRVNVGGHSEFVDCSSLDEEIHVIQWFVDSGEIEFHTNYETGQRKHNERISDYAIVKPYVDAWEIEARKELVPVNAA